VQLLKRNEKGGWDGDGRDITLRAKPAGRERYSESLSGKMNGMDAEG
jgi:hypothetical protein